MSRGHHNDQLIEYLRIIRGIQAAWNEEFAELPQLQRPFYYDLFAWIHECRAGMGAEVTVTQALEGGISVSHRTCQAYIQRAVKNGWLISSEDPINRRRRLLKIADPMHKQFIRSCTRALDLIGTSPLFSSGRRVTIQGDKDDQIIEYLRVRRMIQREWNEEFCDIPELQRPFYHDIFALIHEYRTRDAELSVLQAAGKAVGIDGRTRQTYIQRAIKNGWLRCVEDPQNRRRRLLRMSEDVYSRFVRSCNRALHLVEVSSLFASVRRVA